MKFPITFKQKEGLCLIFYYVRRNTKKQYPGYDGYGRTPPRHNRERDTESKILILNIMAVTYMTEDGLKKMKEELQFLETVERPRIIAAIAEAREKGDLSENAEYDAAKEAQGALETKIAILKSRLMDARVLDTSALDTDEVKILTKVRVRQKNTGMEKTFQLVTEGEANIAEGKISISTPIAKGLLGKKVGEVAQIQVPVGVIEFEILEISL